MERLGVMTELAFLKANYPDEFKLVASELNGAPIPRKTATTATVVPINGASRPMVSAKTRGKKRPHWTQTPEGRAKQSQRMRDSWRRRKSRARA